MNKTASTTIAKTKFASRPGRDDRGALAQPLVVEGDLALGRGQLARARATGSPELASLSPNILT